MASQLQWTRPELLAAQREKRLVDVASTGLRGRILSVREKDIEIDLGFGKGYIAFGSIKSEPPARFSADTRVTTPYGPGRVEELRLSDDRIDYKVVLLDAMAERANSSFAVVYLNPQDVKYRPDDKRLFSEALADAEAFRARGNGAFKQKEHEAADVAYNKAVEVLRVYASGLLPEVRAVQERQLRRLMALVLSARCQNHISRPTPDYASAVAEAEALLVGIDPDNLAGQHAKVLYRRAMAYMGLKEWEKAERDLTHPLVASEAAAKEKLAVVRAENKREHAKMTRMWSGAFAKSAAAATAAAEPNGDASQPSSSGDSTPPRSNSFKKGSAASNGTPATATPPRTVGSAASASASASATPPSSARAGAASSNSSNNNKRGSPGANPAKGRGKGTPYPTAGGRRGAAAAARAAHAVGADNDDEQEEDGIDVEEADTGRGGGGGIGRRLQQRVMAGGDEEEEEEVETPKTRTGGGIDWPVVLTLGGVAVLGVAAAVGAVYALRKRGK